MSHYVGSARDGQRAARGQKTREDQAEGFNKVRKKMRKDTENQIGKLGDKFAESEASSEQIFKAAVMGLQTNEEYARKERVYMKGEKEDVIKTAPAEVVAKIKKRARKRIKKQAVLSFGDSEEEEEEFVVPKKKFKKNPAIDTSFLPDTERDKRDEGARAKLRDEWVLEQERIKNQPLELTYAYWDGSGHRRTTTVKKGTSMEDFLEGARKTLAPHFSDLRGLHGSHLMYIKDELIVPHSYSFYDLIVTNATGPEGALFKLEKYEGIDRDVAKPGKVITRAWYERNKHIYPASRWDTYDPSMHTVA